MIWKNTPDRYGAVHKTLHWVIAVCVLMMLIMGIVMQDIPNGADKFWVYGIHKSLGITILVLMLARVAWRAINRDLPRPHANHAGWERKLAGLVHGGLYVLLIAMPLTGWLGTAAANSTINWFGYFTVPNLIGPDKELRGVLFEMHEIMALGLWGLIGLHIAGALKHTIIDRDDTLRRMVPFGAFMLMLLPAITLAADEAPPSWKIDRERSVLTFTATQEGGPFQGRFLAFDGAIALDPAKPETGNAKITIDLNTFDSGNGERDETVKGKDWFDLETTPTATYTIDRFTRADDGTYMAEGRLFLRGIERPLNLPFTLEVTEENRMRTAHAVGKTSLKRLDFDVGSGQWADEAMVGNDVTIQVDLYATTKSE